MSLLAALPVPFAAASAHAVAPAGETTLVSPGEGETVGGNPTLSWTAVAGAAKYRVQVAKTTSFDSLVYTVDTVNLNATPADSLPVGALYWRVAPTDGTTTGIGAYTVGSFVRQWAEAPNLTSPAQDATLTYPDDPMLFKWDALPGAQKYVVQIDDDVNFVSAVNRETSSTSYTLREPLAAGQQFFWRVQGVSGAAVSPWSDTRVFQAQWPDVPVLLSPPPGTTPLQDVVLRWSPVDGAASYQVQISPNADFTNNLTVDTNVKGTTYARPEGLANGSYYWRVRPVDSKGNPGTGNLGNWSDSITSDGTGLTQPAQFVRGWNQTPTLQWPPATSEAFQITTPTFRWDPLPHASHYELRVGSDSSFSPGSYQTCYTNQTSFTPYAAYLTAEGGTPGACGVNPAPGELYYWTVRGIDAHILGSPILGQFAPYRSFRYLHTSMPGALEPLNAATVAAPTLRWTAVLGVAKYQVTIKDAVTNANVGGSPVTTYATSFTPSGLTAGKTYRWYVQSVDHAGFSGLLPPQEEQPTFVFQPGEAGAVLDLLGPAAGAAAAEWPSLSWTPVTGATDYEVFYDTAGLGTVQKLATTKSTAYTGTDIPPTPDTYIWQIKALNSSGIVIATSTVSTFVVTPIPAVSGDDVLPVNCVPEVQCPLNGETPLLQWTPTPYTEAYIVTIASDEGFTEKAREYVTRFPTVTGRSALLDNNTDGAYYWYVRPCRRTTGIASCAPPPSTGLATAAFRKRSPKVQLTSPADGSTRQAVSGVTFSWEDYTETSAEATPPSTQGARRYRIQVSTNENFASYLENREVEQATFTAFDRAYPEGPLFWRVNAIDGSGNHLTYSDTWLVNKQTPPLTPLHPAPDVTVNRTPYFQWTSQPHAGRYELEVYKNGDTNYSPANIEKMSWTTTSNTTSGGTSTETTAFTPTVGLKPGKYAWRVRRMDDNTVPLPGPWADGGSFTVATAVPTLVSPASGSVATGDDLVFAWSAVEGAVKYKFEAASNSLFSSPIETATTVMTSWAAVKRYPDATYHWRVSAINGDGNVTAVSSVWTLFRDGTPPTVKTKAPTSAAPLGGPFTVTFSEPVKGVSPSTFTVKSTSGGTPIAGTTTPGAETTTATASFTPSVPLVPGETYTVSVGAGVKDVNGNALTPMSWNVRTSTTVDSSLPVVQQYWDRDTSTSASGGGYLASRTPGTRVSYTFTGTSASILGRKAADGGYAEVWLDGVKQATVSFYASTTQWKRTIWSKTGLADKQHKVELRVLGTKPSSATSSWVYPDAFRYGATTLEENSSSVVQSHRTVALAGALGGSYLLAAHTASGDTGTQPYVVLKFRGTGVTWKGIRGPAGGIGKVYVDNVAKATVDTYSGAASGATTLWSIGGLPDATHTLKIVVTGTKSASSAGYNVTFDSFSVT